MDCEWVCPTGSAEVYNCLSDSNAETIDVVHALGTGEYVVVTTGRHVHLYQASVSGMELISTWSYVSPSSHDNNNKSDIKWRHVSGTLVFPTRSEEEIAIAQQQPNASQLLLPRVRVCVATDHLVCLLTWNLSNNSKSIDKLDTFMTKEGIVVHLSVVDQTRVLIWTHAADVHVIDWNAQYLESVHLRHIGVQTGAVLEQVCVASSGLFYAVVLRNATDVIVANFNALLASSSSSSSNNKNNDSKMVVLSPTSSSSSLNAAAAAEGLTDVMTYVDDAAAWQLENKHDKNNQQSGSSSSSSSSSSAPQAVVSCVAMHPSEPRVAVGYSDGHMRVFMVPEGRRARCIEEFRLHEGYHAGAVVDICFASSGAVAVSWQNRGVVVVCGQAVQWSSLPHFELAQDLAHNDSSKTIASTFSSSSSSSASLVAWISDGFSLLVSSPQEHSFRTMSFAKKLRSTGNDVVLTLHELRYACRPGNEDTQLKSAYAMQMPGKLRQWVPLYFDRYDPQQHHRDSKRARMASTSSSVSASSSAQRSFARMPAGYSQAKLPSVYLKENGPLRVITNMHANRYIAVSGTRGAALYDATRRSWRVFGNRKHEASVECIGMGFIHNALCVVVSHDVTLREYYEVNDYCTHADRRSKCLMSKKAQQRPTLRVDLLYYPLNHLNHDSMLYMHSIYYGHSNARVAKVFFTDNCNDSVTLQLTDSIVDVFDVPKQWIVRHVARVRSLLDAPIVHVIAVRCDDVAAVEEKKTSATIDASDSESQSTLHSRRSSSQRLDVSGLLMERETFAVMHVKQVKLKSQVAQEAKQGGVGLTHKQWRVYTLTSSGRTSAAHELLVDPISRECRVQKLLPSAAAIHICRAPPISGAAVGDASDDEDDDRKQEWMLLVTPATPTRPSTSRIGWARVPSSSLSSSSSVAPGKLDFVAVETVEVFSTKRVIGFHAESGCMTTGDARGILGGATMVFHVVGVSLLPYWLLRVVRATTPRDIPALVDSLLQHYPFHAYHIMCKMVALALADGRFDERIVSMLNLMHGKEEIVLRVMRSGVKISPSALEALDVLPWSLFVSKMARNGRLYLAALALPLIEGKENQEVIKLGHMLLQQISPGHPLEEEINRFLASSSSSSS